MFSEMFCLRLLRQKIGFKGQIELERNVKSELGGYQGREQSLVAKLFQWFQESEHSMFQSDRLTSAWTLYT